MKLVKCILLMSTVLMFAWGARADSVLYAASGTTDFTVPFKSMAQGFAVLASSNPITIIAKVGTTAVDTMYVEAGNSMFFYCPSNNLAIDRTLATAVTINPTFNNSILPNLGYSTVKLQAALDSLATLLSAPSPVTFSDPYTMWDLKNFSRTGNDSAMVTKAQTLPVVGWDITGATSILCYADWTFFREQFSIQMLVGPTSAEADTFLTYPIDSSASSTQNFWRIDSLTVKQATGNEGFVFRLSNNGHPFLGFLRARVVVDSGDDLRGFRLIAIKEYGGM